MRDKIIIDPNCYDFGQYLADHAVVEGQSIRRAHDFADEVAGILEHGDKLVGDTLPWNNSHDLVRLGEGEWSVWAGVNGSGKSQLVGQVMTHLMTLGRTVCIASLEMKPSQTISRMVCQSASCKAGKAYGDQWLERFVDTLWIYDQLDRIASDRILGMCHYAAHELGAKHIVIDSLTKCGVGREDYTAQAEFVDRLQWCAKRWNVHLHLVAHMRKSNAPGHIETKDDIRGCAEITDLPDNVFIIRRNKGKETESEKRQNGQDYDDGKLLEPCTYLSVEKNRKYGHEPTFGLWFDQPSGQFMASPGPALPPLELF